MKNEMILKTKRLLLTPMPMEKLEQKAQNDPDPEMRKAYGEMLALCKEKPEEFLWAIPWEMLLKKDRQPVGDLCFKGAPQKGTVELGYGIDKAYEGQGLTTEAVGAMLDWAFAKDNVYAVEAETAQNQLDDGIHVLRHFHRYGSGQPDGKHFHRHVLWRGGGSAAGLRYGCLREEAPGGDPGRGEKVTWLGMTKRSFTISTPWG